MKKLIFLAIHIFCASIVYSQNVVTVGLTISPNDDRSFCPGEYITYSAYPTKPVSGSCQYQWTVTNGEISGVTGNSVINNGQIDVKWNNVTQGTISVVLTGCADFQGSKNINYAIKSISGLKPSTTNGSPSVNVGYCATPATFAINPLQYASKGKAEQTAAQVDSYEWVIPAGWKINNVVSDGSTPFRTSARSISPIPGNCGGDKVRVRGVSFCGNVYFSDYLDITVKRYYGGTISGPSAVSCAAASTVTYSVPALSCASSYKWSLPAGWTGSSTTNSITARSNGQGGKVSVTVNVCGTSVPKELTVGQVLNPIISQSYSSYCNAGSPITFRACLKILCRFKVQTIKDSLAVSPIYPSFSTVCCFFVILVQPSLENELPRGRAVGVSKQT